MKTLFFISTILLIFSNSLCGQNQSEEVVLSDSLTYSSVLPGSLTSGLIKVDTETNSQWIKYTNNLTGSSSRILRILINDTPAEAPAEEVEMEEIPVEVKEPFAGVDSEIDFRPGKISTVTLFLTNCEVFVKGYGYQTKDELQSVIKELISNLNI